MREKNRVIVRSCSLRLLETRWHGGGGRATRCHTIHQRFLRTSTPAVRRCDSSMRQPSDVVQFAPLKPHTVPKRIVFGSCSSQTEDLSYWDRISAAAPDLVILMGDNVYGNRDGGVDKAYQQLKNNCHPSCFRRAAAQTPIIATLDDNDYIHPEGKDAAIGAFLRFFQIPTTDERWTPNRGVYTSYLWGMANQLQVILLDVRYWKSPFRKSSSSSSDWGPYTSDTADVHKTMLGTDQWQWLEQQLEIPVQLRLIVSPIQVLAVGHGWDCWNLLPYERARLLSLISTHATKTSAKTIVLSGDRHVAGFYQKDDLFEVTSSSLTHSVPQGRLDHEVDPTRIGGMVHVNNFGLLELDWDDKELEVSIRRADTGEVVGKEWTRRI
jgi:alkaline phosphatase D